MSEHIATARQARPVRTIRIAIVNRGEAAVRALHSFAEANGVDGIQYHTIALYTDPDRHAPFVRRADEAVCLGPALYIDAGDQRTKHTYLDQVRLEKALLDTRADAVWVGWGFVAEDAGFAARCEALGIRFLGPSAEAMRSLGDKIKAKLVAERAGVPVVPWSGGAVNSLEDARHHAERIGFPLLIKATAGGGGRGIREVFDAGSLEQLYLDARREAESSFGDATVFIERRAAAARHLEVQVLGDAHGTVWVLGVRECSVQRRRQKILEESGLAVPNAAVEARLRRYAEAICRTVGYRNAGTVEFLHEPTTDAIYFMEVNTRLQVEHTVTEAVTGVDLVRYQLHIAFGGRLEGSVPRSSGHAIEVRLNAEDPSRGFAPAPGRVTLYRPPNGPGVRVDSGIAEGDNIPAEFDSMIAKIIVWGPDRTAALRRLRRALEQTEVVIQGGSTNRAFLLDLVQRPEILSGRFHTAWLGELLRDPAQWPQRHADVALVQATIEAYEEDLAAECEHFLATAARGRPSISDHNGRLVELRHGNRTYAIEVLRVARGSYRLTLANTADLDVRVDVLGRHERALFVDGHRYQTLVIANGLEYLIEVLGTSHRVQRNDGGAVRSHCPAVVVAVLVQAGDAVTSGAPLFVLESMKMESTVCAPSAGRVRQVMVLRGAQVDSGDVLARIDASCEERDAGPVAPIVLPTASDGIRDVFDLIASLILGYDVEPHRLDGLDAELAQRYANGLTDVETLLAAEQQIIALFCDVHALAPRLPLNPQSDGAHPEDHLSSYLRQPERAAEHLPAAFLDDLHLALRRYGVDGTRSSQALDEALMRIARSRHATRRQESIIVSILLRWRRQAHHLLPHFTDDFRDLLDRLTLITDSWSPMISDLAHIVRLRYFDQVMLDLGRSAAVAKLIVDLDTLLASTGTPDDAGRRAATIQSLSASTEPCRLWLFPWMKRAGPAGYGMGLEVFLRVQYRHVTIVDVELRECTGRPLLVLSGHRAGEPLKVLGTVCDESSVPYVGIAATVRDLAGNDRVCLEVLHLSSTAAPPDASVEICGADPGLVERVVVTTMTNDPGLPVAFHTYVAAEGRFRELLEYRTLHATTAERLELWRLRNFNITSLSGSAHYHLFAASARDNPRDQRLFAFAEVRDLSPVVDEHGTRSDSLRRLELAALKCMDSLRQQLSAIQGRQRYVSNRIVIYVEPVWERPIEELKQLADRIAPLTRGLFLEQVNLRLRIESPDDPRGWSEAVVNIAIRSGSGVQLGIKAPSRDPIRPLSDHRATSAEMRRLGLIYPYDIVRLLTSPGTTHSDFPRGEFVEYDLSAEARLVPTSRPFGAHTANLAVGIITNFTPKCPDGMSRVLILNDPSKSLASLGEAECQRILAALDLARQRSIPVEWFAVSSGARVAMDSGTENLDWTARVLRRIIELTQQGHEINVVVTGINVGAQSYWNAEATMLMHSRGVLIMVGDSAMVLTGKQALDYSGSISADSNTGIGGYDKIMGVNGEAQYWAPDVEGACRLLFRHYELTYIMPGERLPRPSTTTDTPDRDIRSTAHPAVAGTDFTTVGHIFDPHVNRDRKRPFDVRTVMQAVADVDATPLERWARMRDAETAVVWDTRVGGMPVCMIGFESREQPRAGVAPADGPAVWNAGTLFPQSSKKVARAINAASGGRPVVVLANLSGFDGSPESMRNLQLEYGAEIGRAVVNFRGQFLFCVLSRYHGGAFVVFSKSLRDNMHAFAVEGAYASVLGGAPAAAVVFARDVEQRVKADARVVSLQQALLADPSSERNQLSKDLVDLIDQVRIEKRAEVAREFDSIHSIERARQMGSVDCLIEPGRLRLHVVEQLTLEYGGSRDAPKISARQARPSQPGYSPE